MWAGTYFALQSVTVRYVRRNSIRSRQIGYIFSEARIAEHAVGTVRMTIRDVKTHIQADLTWLQIDHSRGWDVQSTFGITTITAHLGVKIDYSNTTRVYIASSKVKSTLRIEK